MEKRILIAFALSLAVMYAFRVFYPTPPETPVTQSSGTAAATPAVPANTPPPPPTLTPAPVVAPVAAASTEDRQATQAEDFQVETPLYTATLSNHGAVLKSFRPKGYLDTEGHPIELIDVAGGTKLGWPLSMTTLDPKLDEEVSAANFAFKKETNVVSMEYAANGIRAAKVFRFDPENFELSVQATLSRDGKPVPHSLAWRGGFGDQSIAPDPAKRQVLYSSGGSYTRVAVTGIKAPQDLITDRIGVEDQYFLALINAPQPNGVKLQKLEYPGPDGKPVAVSSFSVPVSDQPSRIYIGPKDMSWLAKADPVLPAVADYGFWGFIAKPLNFALLWLHSYIHNYGWSIVTLTLLINFVMFPLRLKQQVSMQKMQKIQPQMRTLQDKYKKLKPTDPKRVEIQSQMMNVYKEHGINPMSGCLPLLLQMPFFFAFFKILQTSIELRQAPWILWITDLSQHDPYYILPIMMAVTMFISQKMTPTTVDPAQAKMMMIMPIMFSAIFLWSSSGLVLYWLTSNVVGIGQQVLINRYWPQAAPANNKQRNKQLEE